MDAISLADDFREFLRLLNSEGVEYLIVGGYAVAVHGPPRSTGDLDVWVAMNEPNAKKLVDVLRTFGFDVPSLSPAIFLQGAKVVRMGLPPVRIEVITSISGVSFDDCSKRAVRVELDGVSIPIIGRADLIQNKRAAGRAKDLADIESLGGNA